MRIESRTQVGDALRAASAALSGQIARALLVAAQVIEAGKVDDLKERHPQLADEIEELGGADPSGRFKYVQWGVKQLKKGGAVKDIIRAMQAFHTNAQRLKKRDINQYKSPQEVLEAVELLGASKGELRRQVKKGAEYLYDDDRFMVVLPKTMKASCHYGRGTRWCISSTESENYFSQYSKDNAYFYFVIDKEAQPQDPHSKLAIRWIVGEQKPADLWTADDDQVSVRWARQHFPLDAVLPVIKKRHKRQKDTPHYAASQSTDPRRLAEIYEMGEPDLDEALWENKNTPFAVLKKLYERMVSQWRKRKTSPADSPVPIAMLARLIAAPDMPDDQAFQAVIDLRDKDPGAYSRIRRMVSTFAARSPEAGRRILREVLDRPQDWGGPKVPNLVSRILPEMDPRNEGLALDRRTLLQLDELFAGTTYASMRERLYKSPGFPTEVLRQRLADADPAESLPMVHGLLRQGAIPKKEILNTLIDLEEALEGRVDGKSPPAGPDRAKRRAQARKTFNQFLVEVKDYLPKKDGKFFAELAFSSQSEGWENVADAFGIPRAEVVWLPLVVELDLDIDDLEDLISKAISARTLARAVNAAVGGLFPSTGWYLSENEAKRAMVLADATAWEDALDEMGEQDPYGEQDEQVSWSRKVSVPVLLAVKRPRWATWKGLQEGKLDRGYDGGALNARLISIYYGTGGGKLRKTKGSPAVRPGILGDQIKIR